tara:strand:+ start:53 stop:400 length:348 start_codon:yes stop_codon:yes gene_type:complete
MELNVKIYVLEVIMGSPDSLCIETIGVYSTKKNALRALSKLPAETIEVVYNVEAFEVDEEPRDIFEDSYDEVKSLMDKGVIDQLVGEDGRFYYVLTDMGKEMAKAMKKKKEDDNS